MSCCSSRLMHIVLQCLGVHIPLASKKRFMMCIADCLLESSGDRLLVFLSYCKLQQTETIVFVKDETAIRNHSNSILCVTLQITLC